MNQCELHPQTPNISIKHDGIRHLWSKTRWKRWNILDCTGDWTGDRRDLPNSFSCKWAHIPKYVVSIGFKQTDSIDPSYRVRCECGKMIFGLNDSNHV